MGIERVGHDSEVDRRPLVRLLASVLQDWTEVYGRHWLRTAVGER